MADFQGEDGFEHNGHHYNVRCVEDLDGLGRSHGQPLFWYWTEGRGVTHLTLNPSHPVFRTVSPVDETIMSVVWWQLAAWIAEDLHASKGGAHDPIGRMTRTYLSLRAQNPERRDV